MVIFWIIYISGIIATLWTYYHTLEVGEEVSLLGLSFVLVSSLFSWGTFFIIILVVYGDKIVFKKK